MGGMSLATAQAAAAAAVALMPPPAVAATAAGCATTVGAPTTAAGTGAATATKWWHDPQLTFGPPVDPELVARRAAATAALGAREGPEVQSAPAGGTLPSLPSLPADPRARRGGMFASEGTPPGRLSRSLKRKAAAADADEASSGTTGHEHAGPAASPGGTFKVGGQDVGAAHLYSPAHRGLLTSRPRPRRQHTFCSTEHLHVRVGSTLLLTWQCCSPGCPPCPCSLARRSARSLYARATPAGPAPMPLPLAPAAPRTRTPLSCCWQSASSEAAAAATQATS